MTIHISHTQPSKNLSYVVIGTRLEVTAACIKSIQTKKSKIKYSNILQILKTVTTIVKTICIINKCYKIYVYRTLLHCMVLMKTYSLNAYVRFFIILMELNALKALCHFKWFKIFDWQESYYAWRMLVPILQSKYPTFPWI